MGRNVSTRRDFKAEQSVGMHVGTKSASIQPLCHSSDIAADSETILILEAQICFLLQYYQNQWPKPAGGASSVPRIGLGDSSLGHVSPLHYAKRPPKGGKNKQSSPILR